LTPQITVLDAGGQYCHLIARKVRDLGVYADVAPSETPVSSLAGRKGVIISGGPASVHDLGSPTVDPQLLAAGTPVLGICYGQQLMAHLLGGDVRKGQRGEYGFAHLEIAASHVVSNDGIFRGIAGRQQVWMSHFDTVVSPPAGFSVLASTETCAIAAIAAPDRRLYAVQFHPEVAHTPCGRELLSNFLFDICQCEKDWDPAGQIRAVEDRIRAVAAGRNIFFFVSGGVDSTVAYTLCLRAVGADKVHATYVDTGLMREGETEFVREHFARLAVAQASACGDSINTTHTLAQASACGDPVSTPNTVAQASACGDPISTTNTVAQASACGDPISTTNTVAQASACGDPVSTPNAFAVADAREQFLTALAGVTDPEAKRHIIGEQFVEVQQTILESEHYLDGQWILGQGTIYPDTIESKGSAKADLIKTHHNRVAGIQKLIEAGRIVEPLASFYKDEVRAIGRQLGIGAELLDRHPFPGPGLAIRCLCSEPFASQSEAAPVRTADGWILPVRSVGVQGDARTYRAALALEDFPESEEEAARLVNGIPQINRVVVAVWTAAPLGELRAIPATLTAERLARLRRADAIVRRISVESGFDAKIWQFPVVLIPLGLPSSSSLGDPSGSKSASSASGQFDASARGQSDSVVLRPIQSVDGMTANAVWMPKTLLAEMVEELRAMGDIAGVFYDLTHKPPATIEWE
jgi:GMP synthase (glutamine-hydrolysing) A subunit